MTTQYTNRFRFNKPDFRTSPWSALINENSDRIDQIIYSVMQVNNIITFANNSSVVAGQIVYDDVTGALWICRVTHTTVAIGTFSTERATNPDDWTPLNLGIDISGRWLTNTYYAVNVMAYDATEGLTGICSTEHTSPITGSMRDEIDKWDIIFDASGGGGFPATDVAYDDTVAPYVAANVQEAIDEINSAVLPIPFISLGNVSGTVGIDADTSNNFRMVLTGTTSLVFSNIKDGQEITVVIKHPNGVIPFPSLSVGGGVTILLGLQVPPGTYGSYLTVKGMGTDYLIASFFGIG